MTCLNFNLKQARAAFTLIEIMIVVLIIGVMAAVLVPRIAFNNDTRLTLVQRCLSELNELALEGASVRLVVTREDTRERSNSGERGFITAEALIKKQSDENSLASFLGTDERQQSELVWTSIKLEHSLPGNCWLLEPEIIYFYTDGSCTPAKISWQAPGDAEAEIFILTVTGYCEQLKVNS